VKCHATENTYSKNSSVIPKKFSIYRSCIKREGSVCGLLQGKIADRTHHAFIFQWQSKFPTLHFSPPTFLTYLTWFIVTYSRPDNACQIKCIRTLWTWCYEEFDLTWEKLWFSVSQILKHSIQIMIIIIYLYSIIIVYSR
jgi:hypothetical protein